MKQKDRFSKNEKNETKRERGRARSIRATYLGKGGGM
jgi:hypothetical protein